MPFVWARNPGGLNPLCRTPLQKRSRQMLFPFHRVDLSEPFLKHRIGPPRSTELDPQNLIHRVDPGVLSGNRYRKKLRSTGHVVGKYWDFEPCFSGHMSCVQKLNNSPSGGSLSFFGARLLFFTIRSFLGIFEVKRRQCSEPERWRQSRDTFGSFLNCPISQKTRIWKKWIKQPESCSGWDNLPENPVLKWC